MAEPSPWWQAGVHADRRALLIARARLSAALRSLFTAWGFLEVETAILQVSPGNETHLHALGTEVLTPDGRALLRYLRTSPEFACKKLLAAGERQIFEFARAFRNREQGALHHPEFTLLEWYRAGAPYTTVMEDCAAILVQAAQALGSRQLSFKGRVADPFAAPTRITVADAFARFAGIDLFATMPRQLPDRQRLAQSAIGAGIRVAPDDTWSDIFSKVLVERVEPNLGHGCPTLLYEYPLPEAALARPTTADPRVAERFELYACGVELANGFGELTDAGEQRRRFEAAMNERERIWGDRYPLDEEFLAAVAAMPAASGVALGFDRLMMLLTGASRIDEVIFTPFS